MLIKNIGKICGDDLGLVRDKEAMKVKAKEHHEEMLKRFPEEISECVKNTDIILDWDSSKVSITKDLYPNCELIFANGTTGDAISQIDFVGKTAVLNYASFVKAGGLFMDGSIAQEEALCHDSFLYEILSDSRFAISYYNYNLSDKNFGRFYNRMLYTPNVLFRCGKQVDVITCAAVNMTYSIRAYSYNLEEWKKSERAMIDRIIFILAEAHARGVRNIILGAYGCGIFRNDPKFIATIFKKCFDNYFVNCFEKIIFAIPGGPNYDKFWEVLKG